MSGVREAQDRAAQWIVAREEPGWSDEDQAAFDAWLAVSDLHRVAWLRLDEGWRQTDRIRALGVPETPPAEFTPLVYRTPKRRWLFPASIAASLMVVVGLNWNSAPVSESVAGYHTPVGGHRQLALADGSKVELNTASSARAALDTDRREIWLDRGEAFFDIAHDPSRPFIVHAGSREITVLGTKFSVRRDGERVTVSVLEGRVRIDEVSGPGIGRSTTITGGDIAVAQGEATLVTAKSDQRVEGALAWREGILSFDQIPLEDIAAEFNRYNRKRLIIDGADAAEIRIGGTFPLSKPRAFASLLRDAYGLRVEETDDAIKISH